MCKTLLSLFDYSGNWSLPYMEAGWNVIQIDRKIMDDDGFRLINKDLEQVNAEWIYENIFDSYGTVDGIIAAPPCTDFALSGAKHWAAKDKPIHDLFGEYRRLDTFIELIYQTLRIVDLCQPDFWALENPVGRLNSLVPLLQEHGPRYFQPYQYGDAYSKRTGLWGDFRMPDPTNIVEPVKGKHGSITQKLGGKSERTKELRSMTPMGFAYAFYQANH